MKISTKADSIKFLNHILEAPLNYFYKNQKFTGVNSIHEEQIPEFEMFSRLCYGIASKTKIGIGEELLNLFNKRIINGVNTNSNSYFGELYDYDQKNVELIPLLLVIILNKENTWCKYSDVEKDNIVKWFGKINDVKLINNNWQFFGLLTNEILKELDPCFDSKSELYWNKINEFYIADGWYRDGDSKRKDYYISFGFHFYSLIYIYLFPNAKQRDIIVKRAEEFSKSYQYFFDDIGRSIPYGRSLIYRFASISFWSMLAVNKIYPVDLSIIKSIIFKNLSWWSDQNIFDIAGFLNLGYAYPNQYITEDYNSWGSPYWCLKAFVFLLADDDFFNAPISEIKECCTMSCPDVGFIVSKDFESTTLYISDIGSDYVTQSESKYNRFVYNSKYGFNLCKSLNSIRDSGLESTLAITKDMNHFFTKEKSIDFQCRETYITNYWEIDGLADIKSVIIPLNGPSHLRIHYINANKTCFALDFGYPYKISKFGEVILKESDGKASFKCNDVNTIIKNIVGLCDYSYYRTTNNLNVYNYLTFVPYCKYNLKKGNNLIITFFCDSNDDFSRYSFNIGHNMLKIRKDREEIVYPLNKIMKVSFKRIIKHKIKKTLKRIIL